MNYLLLFSIHPIFLFEFIFFGGIILKVKRFVIQWRKFEFKRSYIFKDIDFRIFWIFLDFSKISSLFLRI